MRVIVMFDLPAVTAKEKAVHARFRKDLIREGFLMMQESVYSKLALNAVSANLIRDRINQMKPARGIIQILTITEKQYSHIEYLLGGPQTEQVDSEERMLVF